MREGGGEGEEDMGGREGVSERGRKTGRERERGLGRGGGRQGGRKREREKRERVGGQVNVLYNTPSEVNEKRSRRRA